MSTDKYKVIGVMSGTSLDGLDLAFCEFEKEALWKFKLIRAKTIAYDDQWRKRLKEAVTLDPEELAKLDSDFGKYIGEQINQFREEEKITFDYISSHGHTVHHQPQKGITIQIGSGLEIRNATGVSVICDFRKGDVALGGQGAPLVPIGDRLLFEEMDYCLNLGGIANISFEKNNERIAFDICACNIVLNLLAEKLGSSFDKDGAFANSGELNKKLLDELNELPYYQKAHPKSLGREDIEREVFPILNKYEIKSEDLLRTFCKHIAIQIEKVIGSEVSNSKMLITGGGTLNHFLLKQIEDECHLKIVVPAKAIIDFKEAIIFGFLGVLKIRNENNCLSSVTGASKDSSGGDVFLINQNQ